jgi:drug/metabolite transporter (DMT)-like permease
LWNIQIPRKSFNKKSMTRNSWFHYLILFLGILCISWSAIFVKLADVSGLSSAFYRMFIGFMGVLPVWLLRKKNIPDKETLRIAVLCGVIFACDIAVWNVSILLTKAAISTLIANLAPVWVGIGAIVFLKEKPGRIFWIGTVIALFGVSVIVGIDKIYNSRLNVGHFLAMLASLFYAFYLLIMRKGRLRLDTVTFTMISMLVSSVVLFIICVLTGTQFSGFSVRSWEALIGLGLISQLGGWLAINYAMAYMPPTIASVSLLSQSVFTAIIAIPVLGEQLTKIEIFGAVIVLAGIFLVNKKMFKRKVAVLQEFD